MDLGPCNKIHEAALKADFELASKKRDYGYDVDVSRVHVKAKAEVLEVRLVILDILLTYTIVCRSLIYFYNSVFCKLLLVIIYENNFIRMPKNVSA